MNRPLMLELVDGTDVIFHLAAAVGVRLIVEKFVYTIETNIKATELVLELAARKHPPLLLASTSEVYGKLDKPKFSEDDDPHLPGPVVLRRLQDHRRVPGARLLLKEKGLPAAVMVVPRFVRLALAGQPIPVYGDGTQRRSFTWVGDVIGAMLALIEHPKAHGEVFNIGHTKEISIYDLAVLVKQMTNSPSEIVLVPYEETYEAGFSESLHMRGNGGNERTVGVGASIAGQCGSSAAGFLETI